MWWPGKSRDCEGRGRRIAQQEIRWPIQARATGVLRVLLTGPRLDVRELDAMVKRLRDVIAGDTPNEIVFDFTGVETIGPHWTLVLALLMRFARAIRTKCRVVSLHGQPAAVVSLYHRNTELGRLVGMDTQTCHAALGPRDGGQVIAKHGQEAGLTDRAVE